MADDCRSDCRLDRDHTCIVNCARKRIPDECVVCDLADLFKVFSDSTRMKMLWTMDGGEMCVCGIADALGMSASAVSHQLKTLKSFKLVSSRRVGKKVYYSLNDDHVNSIMRIALEHLTE
ncbi:MAG: metalloregulator ArsR/SmtB family transcription factor [Candidatus Methanoplasma sp.]|jgi:ArsR family transcriptional regulator|nr:metalloregulator ArsR/SmtB family transcription factor [Candidatus Methanoplasma sp.]